MKELAKVVARGLLLCGSVLFALQAAAARVTGDSMAKAKSVAFSARQGSVSGTLVDEFDTDWNENTGWPVYWFKATLRKNTAYTIWTTGGTTDAPLSIESQTDPNKDVWTWFTVETAKDGYNGYGTLAVADWDEDDPSSVVFYFCVAGDDVGQSFTFNYQQGIVADDSGVLGSELKPQSISVGESETKLSGKGLTDFLDQYWYKTGTLAAGEKYYFAVTAADTNVTADISFSNPEDSDIDFEWTRLSEKDESEARYQVVPSVAGPLHVTVDCEGSYTFRFWKLGAAKPAQHEFVDLVQKDSSKREVALTGVVTDEECAPLYRNNTDATGKFDAVIDQALYRVKLARNVQYRFRVVGEGLTETEDEPNFVSKVAMEVYDANGKVVASAGDDAAAVSDGQVTLYYTPTADAYYWVGVCQTKLDEATGEDDESVAPDEITCTFTAMPVSDSFDPKDDVPTGATQLAFRNTDQAVTGRTLCGTDVADWFKFTANAGTYYTVGLDDGAIEGVLLRVYKANERGVLELDEDENPSEDDLVVEGLEQVVLAAEKATYYLCVIREEATEETEAAYGLVYRSTTVGQVLLNGSAVRGTDYTAVATRSNVGALTMRIRRTAKEGRVRVRYSTHADTATAGVDYVAKSGELEWADGDNKDRTVEVPIIPELNNKYRGNRQFTFEITAIPEGEIEPDEWPASLGTPSKAVVTISDANMATPGKVALVAADGVSFATPLRPTAVVSTGNALELTLSRTDGADGKIGVLVATQAGTAKASTDKATQDFVALSEKVYWEDGETGDKTVTISTESKDAYAADKTFTVRLTALVASAAEPSVTQRATLGASSATITLRYADVSQSSAEYVASLGARPTVTVRPGTATAWYVDSSEMLTTAKIEPNKKADLTLTVTGPGRLEVNPMLSGDATIKVTVGRTVYTDIGDLLSPLYLGKGAQTVRFEATATKDGTGATLSFAKVAGSDGYFSWTALPLVTCLYPVDRSGVVALDSGTVTFAWADANACCGTTPYQYRFYLGTDQRNLELYAAYDSMTTYMMELSEEEPELEPNKTYYWRVDTGFDENLINTNTVWSFKTVESMPAVTVTPAGSDTTYSSADQAAAAKSVIALCQGVSATLALGSDTTNAVTYSVVGGRLPDGLRVDANARAIVGVPTKAGSYTATLQAKSVNLAGATLTLAFEVADAGLAAGTFAGLADLTEAADGDSGLKPQEKLASVTVTATATGGLTARAIVAGTTYSFRATGFLRDEEAQKAGVATAHFEATARFGKETVTNALDVALPYGNEVVSGGDDGSAPAIPSDLYDWFTPAATVIMKIHAANADRVTCTTNTYKGSLCRDSAKVAGITAKLAEWAGYYTVSLPALGATDGEPQGAGYLTVTLDAKGTARLAGQLADGTAVSGSAFAAAVRGTTEGDYRTQNDTIMIPVFYARNKTAFGGWLYLRRAEDGTAYADSSLSYLRWYEGDATKTYDGETGYSLELTATGGWFDKLQQLYTYYLDKKVTVDIGIDGDSLKEEAYPAGYDTFAFYPSLAGEALTVSFMGNKASVARRTLVKQEGSRTLNDFEASTNACNVTLAFTRATGIFSGTLGLWFEGENAKEETIQRELTGLRYQGVLTPVKEPTSFYDDVPGLGYLLVPTRITVDRLTRTWNGSYLFSLKATDADEPDQEDPVPHNAGDDENGEG